MAHTVKAREERKLELLEVAHKLFHEVGYEDTSVESIIRAVGIAKGTFYHYFKSKEDLLQQLTDWEASQVFEEIEEKTSKSHTHALKEFQIFCSTILRWKITHADMMMALVRVLSSDENIALRHKLGESLLNKLSPLLGHIIEQGVKEGVFNVEDPHETSEIFLAMTEGIQERLYPLLLSLEKQPEHVPLFIKKLKATEDAFERVLGAKKGTLKMYNYKAIKDFFKTASKKKSKSKKRKGR